MQVGHSQLFTRGRNPWESHNWKFFGPGPVKSWVGYKEQRNQDSFVQDVIAKAQTRATAE